MMQISGEYIENMLVNMVLEIFFVNGQTWKNTFPWLFV
jgi:hypothetical protein